MQVTLIANRRLGEAEVEAAIDAKQYP